MPCNADKNLRPGQLDTFLASGGEEHQLQPASNMGRIRTLLTPARRNQMTGDTDMTAGQGGIGLDGSGALSQGGRLKSAAEDLESVGKLLRGAIGRKGAKDGSADERFGDYGPDRSFPTFCDAWNEEIDLLAQTLRELHEKIGEGVATTRGQDVREGESFRFVGTAAKTGSL